MKKFKFLDKKMFASLPKTPGVYVFKSERIMLYIGKATSIKQRVKNHFYPHTKQSYGVGVNQPGFRDNLFISEVEKIGYIKTDSEIEALLLEAKLIKKYQPKFNVLWRDDKNYFYVGITKEDYPRVFITHQIKGEKESGIRNQELGMKKKISHNSLFIIHNSKYLGPFVDGKALKLVLKVLRKVFPYRTCKTLPKRPCLWHELHRCPGPCLLKSTKIPLLHSSSIFVEKVEEMKRVCQKDASNLVRVLQGTRVEVLKSLQKEMKEFSNAQEFEKAAKLRDQITALESIVQHAHVFQELPTKEKQNWLKTEKELRKILGLKGLNGKSKGGMFFQDRRKSSQKITRIKRIEGYDVSNIQGQEATGAMVVFENGEPNKKEYRKFKIKISGKPNDIAMLKEVLSRRLQHPEWSLPQLILVDGGKAQLNASNLTIKQFNNLTIKTMALAKRKNELHLENKKKPIALKNLSQEISNLILHLRDEAHRFAIKYHKELRKKSLYA